MLGKIRQKLVTQQQPEEFKQVELLCPICDRPIPDSQKDAHHFIPKSKGGKATEYLHRICHRQIHALFTETQLAKELNTAEAIKERQEIQKFIAWVKNKPNHFYQRSSKSNLIRR
jgi:5-methylcytosine-specific restriction endonuclease McrA